MISYDLLDFSFTGSECPNWPCSPLPQVNLFQNPMNLFTKKKNFSHNSPLSLIAATCFEPTEMWTNFSRVDRFNKVGRLTLELVWLSCPRIPPYEEIYDTIKGEGRPLIDPRYMYSHPPKWLQIRNFCMLYPEFAHGIVPRLFAAGIWKFHGLNPIGRNYYSPRSRDSLLN